MPQAREARDLRLERPRTLDHRLRGEGGRRDAGPSVCQVVPVVQDLSVLADRPSTGRQFPRLEHFVDEEPPPTQGDALELLSDGVRPPAAASESIVDDEHLERRHEIEGDVRVQLLAQGADFLADLGLRTPEELAVAVDVRPLMPNAGSASAVAILPRGWQMNAATTYEVRVSNPSIAYAVEAIACP